MAKFDINTATKIVDFAYPTSTTAIKAKMADTGCYVLYYLDGNWNKKDLGYYQQKHNAISEGEKLPQAWNWMHVKFN